MGSMTAEKSALPPDVSLPAPIHPDFISRLDQDFIEYYNEHFASKAPTHHVSIADMRANPSKYYSPWYKDFSKLEFVNDISITSDDGHVFTARVYHPDAVKSPFGAGPYPVYINFHGGGFTFGDLMGDAEICMAIRDRLGMMVIDVDYRLCPEHVYGKGQEDAWAAVRYVHSNGTSLNIRPESISIGGISAGGSLSASVQLLARDAGIELRLAILSVPVVTYHGMIEKLSDSRFKSMSENALAPCLNWERLSYFQQHHKPKNEAEKAYIVDLPEAIRNPIDCDHRGLCETMILTADCDPVRDEGEVYGQKLVEAGVRISMRRYMGVPHPFMHMAPLKKAQLYWDDITAELKRVHFP
ncbi:Alpha/Beta hydrolase protein [Xylariales sp. PMI_506]|nr:Alpha/Beta hydrolase protein [Xylariales sp. PMI_506]